MMIITCTIKMKIMKICLYNKKNVDKLNLIHFCKIGNNYLNSKHGLYICKINIYEKFIGMILLKAK